MSLLSTLVFLVAGGAVATVGAFRVEEMLYAGQKLRAGLWALGYGVLAALLLFSTTSFARDVETECPQAADMLVNIAKYRDAGNPPGPIFGAWEHDMILIQGVPPKLRWFVETEEDAVLLYDWIVRVFDKGESVDDIRFRFMIECTRGQEG